MQAVLENPLNRTRAREELANLFSRNNNLLEKIAGQSKISSQELDNFVGLLKAALRNKPKIK